MWQLVLTVATLTVARTTSMHLPLRTEPVLGVDDPAVSLDRHGTLAICPASAVLRSAEAIALTGGRKSTAQCDAAPPRCDTWVVGPCLGRVHAR